MPRYAAGSTSQGTFSVDITPVSADGAALGTIALPWSDLRLASGAVIDVGNGEMTLTFAANSMTVAGGVFLFPTSQVSAPGIALTTETNTGIHFPNTGQITSTIAGTARFTVLGGSVRLPSQGDFLYLDDGTTGFQAESANVIQFNADAAVPVTATLKGSDARAGTDTNTVGGAFYQAGGRPTGTGVPGLVGLRGSLLSTTSGTAASALIDRFIANAARVLTNNSAIGVVDATVAAGTSAGGLITYTIEVWDGTDNQVESGQAVYSTMNKGGVISGTVTEVNSQQNLNSGTLATTWAISAANPAVISVNANSSLTPSTGFPRITYSVTNLGQQGVAI